MWKATGLQSGSFSWFFLGLENNDAGGKQGSVTVRSAGCDRTAKVAPAVYCNAMQSAGKGLSVIKMIINNVFLRTWRNFWEKKILNIL